MMALSMAVIASVIGARRPRRPRLPGFASVDVRLALAAGIPIVLLRRRRRPRDQRGRARDGATTSPPSPWRWGVVAAGTVVESRSRPASPTASTGPDAWIVNIADPVNDAVDWMTDHLYAVSTSAAPPTGPPTSPPVLDPVRSGLTTAALVVRCC